MSATISHPKLFGWCHKVQSEVLLSVDRQAREGRMRSLTATEADLLALALLKHVSSHLRFVAQVRSLTSSFATTAEKAKISRRNATGGTLTGALLEIDLDAKVTAIGRLAYDLLQIGMRRLERSVAPGLTADAVLQREPHAAGYFLYTLSEHWWKLPGNGGRCPVTGLSRTTLHKLAVPCIANNHQPPVKSIVLRKNKYATRGIRLIVRQSLLDHLKTLET